MDFHYCRLCLKNDIWNSPVPLFTEEFKLQQRIQDVFGIKVSENDELSKVICHMCLANLEFTYGFYQTVKSSNKILVNVTEVARKCFTGLPSLPVGSALATPNLLLPKTVVNAVDSIPNKESTDCILKNVNKESTGSNLTNVNKDSLDSNLTNVNEEPRDSNLINVSDVQKKPEDRVLEEKTPTKAHEKDAKRKDDDVDLWIICQKCNFTTQRRCAMLSHMRKHERVWLRNCPRCPRSFDREVELIRHLKEYHKQRTVKMEYHICEICKKGFMDKSLYLKHKRLHNKNISNINNKNKRKENKVEVAEKGKENKKEERLALNSNIFKDKEAANNKNKSNTKKNEKEEKKIEEIKGSNNNINNQLLLTKAAIGKSSPKKILKKVNKNNNANKYRKPSEDKLKVEKQKSSPSEKAKNGKNITGRADEEESKSEDGVRNAIDGDKEPDKKKKKLDIMIEDDLVGNIAGDEMIEEDNGEDMIKWNKANKVETSSITEEEEPMETANEDSDIDIDAMIESEILHIEEEVKKLGKFDRSPESNKRKSLDGNSSDTVDSERNKIFKPSDDGHDKHCDKPVFESNNENKRKVENTKENLSTNVVHVPSKLSDEKYDNSSKKPVTNTSITPNKNKEKVNGEEIECTSSNSNPVGKISILNKTNENLTGEKLNCTAHVSSKYLKKSTLQKRVCDVTKEIEEKLMSLEDASIKCGDSIKSTISNKGEENLAVGNVACDGSTTASSNVLSKTLIANKSNKKFTGPTSVKCNDLSKYTLSNNYKENSSGEKLTCREKNSVNSNVSSKTAIGNKTKGNVSDEKFKSGGHAALKFNTLNKSTISNNIKENGSGEQVRYGEETPTVNSNISSQTKQDVSDEKSKSCEQASVKCNALRKSTGSNTTQGNATGDRLTCRENKCVNSNLSSKTVIGNRTKENISVEKLNTVGHASVKCNTLNKSTISNNTKCVATQVNVTYEKLTFRENTLNNSSVSSKNVIENRSKENISDEKSMPVGHTSVKYNAFNKSTVPNITKENLTSEKLSFGETTSVNCNLSSRSVVGNRSKESVSDEKSKPVGHTSVKYNALSKHTVPNITKENLTGEKLTCGENTLVNCNVSSKIGNGNKGNVSDVSSKIGNGIKGNVSDEKYKTVGHASIKRNTSVKSITSDTTKENITSEKLKCGETRSVNSDISTTAVVVNRSKETVSDEKTKSFGGHADMLHKSITLSKSAVSNTTKENLTSEKLTYEKNTFCNSKAVSKTDRSKYNETGEKSKSIGHEYVKFNAFSHKSTNSNKNEENATGDKLTSEENEVVIKTVAVNGSKGCVVEKSKYAGREPVLPNALIKSTNSNKNKENATGDKLTCGETPSCKPKVLSKKIVANASDKNVTDKKSKSAEHEFIKQCALIKSTDSKKNNETVSGEKTTSRENTSDMTATANGCKENDIDEKSKSVGHASIECSNSLSLNTFKGDNNEKVKCVELTDENSKAISKVVDVNPNESVTKEKIKFTDVYKCAESIFLSKLNSYLREVAVDEYNVDICKEMINIIKDGSVNVERISLSDEEKPLVIDENQSDMKVELESISLSEEFPIVIDEIKVETDEDESEAVKDSIN